MTKDIKFWKNLIKENWWLSIGVALVAILVLSVVWSLIFQKRTVRSYQRYEADMDVSSGEVAPTTTRAMTDEEWGAVENEEDGL